MLFSPLSDLPGHEFLLPLEKMERIRKSLIVIVWKKGPGSLDRKILLLKLNPDRGNFWQSPTGHVEMGESFTEAALREAQEETQLNFSRVPQYLGLEYEFDGRWGPVRERAFMLLVHGGENPPTPIIDPSEHCDFTWVSPQEALQMVPHQGNKDAILRSSQEVPPLLLSKYGVFFQDGEEITHERTVELLHRALQRDPSGSYKVKIGEEEIDVIVEETPLFVKSYDRGSGMITFTNGHQEKLNPESIEIRKNNSWICKSAENWPALFLKPAYYEITKEVKPGLVQGEFILNFLGRDYALRVSA